MRAPRHRARQHPERDPRLEPAALKPRNLGVGQRVEITEKILGALKRARRVRAGNDALGVEIAQVLKVRRRAYIAANLGVEDLQPLLPIVGSDARKIRPRRRGVARLTAVSASISTPVFALQRAMASIAMPPASGITRKRTPTLSSGSA